MKKEIGSNFWFDIDNLNLDNEIRDDELIHSIIPNYPGKMTLLGSGREAIRYLLKHLKTENKKVLLPAFTCHSVIAPFIHENYKITYFNILQNLEPDERDFIKKVQNIKPAIVLFHRYFGFDTLRSLRGIIKEIRKQNFILIEDISQGMLSKLSNANPDFYVASLRKLFPVLDGGILIENTKKIIYDSEPLKENSRMVDYKIQAFKQKLLYMERNVGSKEDFLKLFRISEELLDNSTEIFGMSTYSKDILKNINITDVIKNRRANFNYLTKNLGDNNNVSLIFNNCRKSVTPLYCPILVHNRKAMQKKLAKNHIYAPILWPKSDYIKDIALSSSTQFLYDSLLALPCDQRYSTAEMQYIIDTIGSKN